MHDHPPRDLGQLVQQRLQAAGAQIQFFDQPHGLVAAAAPAGARRARRLVIGVLRLMATRKSARLRRSRWASVFRFGPSRSMIFFLPAVLVTETSIVRSSRNLPSRTFSSRRDGALQQIIAGQHAVAETAARAFDALGRIDFLLPRLSSGISPICIRYIRTGSSIWSSEPLVSASSSAAASKIGRGQFVELGFVERRAVFVISAIAIGGFTFQQTAGRAVFGSVDRVAVAGEPTQAAMRRRGTENGFASGIFWGLSQGLLLDDRRRMRLPGW